MTGHEAQQVGSSPEQQRPAASVGHRAALWGAIGCIILIVAFGFFFSALAVQQHRTYLTHGLDIGNVDQALWNTAHGRFLHFTLMTPHESRLALHVEPILLLFVPFYWFNLGGPELLLVAQAFIVALGAWAVYRLTVRTFRAQDASSSLSRPGHGPAKQDGYPVLFGKGNELLGQFGRRADNFALAAQTSRGAHHVMEVGQRLLQGIIYFHLFNHHRCRVSGHFIDSRQVVVLRIHQNQTFDPHVEHGPGRCPDVLRITSPG